MLVAAAGLAPITAIVIYFKMALAPANDLAANLTGSMIRDYLSDPPATASSFAISERASSISARASCRSWRSDWLLAGCARPPDEPPRSGLGCLAALVLLFVCDFCVYIITPHDLAWHLKTSRGSASAATSPICDVYVVFASARKLFA